jgi:Flp pilus assembly protein TadD
MSAAQSTLAAHPEQFHLHALIGYFAARLGDDEAAYRETKEALKCDAKDSRVIRRTALTYAVLNQSNAYDDVMKTAASELRGDLSRHPDLSAFPQEQVA